MHRTQVNLEEEHYRWLKQQAGSGSIAAVVRRLIDAARARSIDPERDPAIRYLLDEPAATESAATSVTTLDDDLYGA